MLPAQQGFCLDDAPRGQLDHRLEVHTELFAGDGTPQIGNQTQAVLRCFLQLGREIAVTIAPQTFRQIHRLIRIAEQLVDVVGIGGIQRDTHAGRNIDFILTKHERGSQVAQDVAGNALDDGVVVGHQTGQQDGEFITTQTGNGIRFAHAGTNALGGFQQELVACIVAQRVIDFLEAIQINEEQGHLRTRPPRLLDFLADALMEHAAIG